MNYKQEATKLGHYFLGKQPVEAVIALYEEAMQSLGIVASGKDERLLHFMLKHSWSIGLIDSGQALLNPASVIRRKLFIMLAILETEPAYASLFLPTPKSFILIFFAGCRAVLKALAGIVLVKLI